MQRRPSGNVPGARPRLRVVGYPWEPPAQLDSGRQLSLLIEDGADRGGIGLGDDEHPKNMAVRTTAGKRGCAAPAGILDAICYQCARRRLRPGVRESEFHSTGGARRTIISNLTRLSPL